MDSSLSNIWQKIINFKLTVFEFLTFKNIGMYQTQFVKSTVFLKLTHLPIKEQHMLYFVLKKKKLSNFYGSAWSFGCFIPATTVIFITSLV